VPKQRRRRRGPAELPGKRRARYPFPVNLIFNVKAFYLFFIVIMIASMAAVGLGSGFTGGSNEGAPIVDDPFASAEATPEADQWPEPGPVLDATQPHVATLTTNQGEIVIELSTAAPAAVNSFAFLAAKNFYDGTAFFYVDKDYFAQAGDPTCAAESENICSGLGGPGYTLNVEDSGLAHAQWAVVAPSMGDGAPDVHGSQFRILYTTDERLDGAETVFGTVVEGQDILEGLADFSVCSVSTASDCQEDLTSALIIEDVKVQAAA
jgi:peptidyl-prolyl cis-trans isomerase B (cyclophilin B)